MSKHPLAIMTPQFGTRSETFIRRHLNDLMPGETACLYGRRLDETADEWGFNGPCLDLSIVAPEEEEARFGEGDKQHLDFQFSGAAKEKIHAFLLEHRVEVLLAQFLDRSLPWIQVARDLGLRYYVHAHGYDVSMLLRSEIWRKEYLRLNNTDGIITVNQISKRRLIDLGIREELLHVIPCCVSPTNHKQKVQNGNSVRCLAVGRMVGKKAPIFTLEAFRQALVTNPGLRLDYIGDGVLMPAVHHYIHITGLSDKVVLHGSMPNIFVQDMMAKADVFIHHAVVDPVSGDEEGLPVAILEAMQHRLPVVSTRHAGIPDAVISGVTGYVVEEGDTADMADKIGLLASDSNMRKTFGEAGHKRVQNAFSWDSEKNRLLDLMGLN